jgi:hypothetical protein
MARPLTNLKEVIMSYYSLLKKERQLDKAIKACKLCKGKMLPVTVVSDYGIKGT